MGKIKLGLRTKIFIGLGISYLTILCTAYWVLKNMNKIQEIQSSSHAEYQKMDALRKVEELVVLMELSASRYMLSGIDESLQPFAQSQETFEEIIEDIKVQFDSQPNQVTRLDQVKGLLREWVEIVAVSQMLGRRKLLVGMINFEQFQEIHAKGKGQALIVKVEQIIAEGVKEQKERIAKSNNDVKLLSQSTAFWTTISLVGAIFFGVAIQIFITRNSLRQLLDLARKVAEDSLQMKRISDQVASSSQEIKETTLSQKKSIEVVVSNMEQMSGTITQTSKNADDSVAIAEFGAKETSKGLTVVTKMLDSMQELEQCNHRLRDLVGIIANIDEKTKVINDIVSETRLLSFNASIEAARAGVHGRGFAIVAEEVGKLASISGEAAEEISGILNRSMMEASEVVELTSQKVKSGIDRSQNCEAVFNETSEAMTKILSSSRDINSATSEQESGVAESNRTMTEMESIAQKNSAEALELSEQGEQLRVSSDRVAKNIDLLQQELVGRNRAA